ncbi:MAG: hypothetical protein AB1744_05700 [Candidatus Zixiibacteriota bacterium]
MQPDVQSQNLTERVSEYLGEYSGFLETIKGWIVAHFGETGLIAAGIGLAAIALLLVMRLTKVGFAIVKYMALPGVALAMIGSLVLSQSFFLLLPITVMACSLLLLFKG